jgi:hypothetical protein
VGFVTKHESRDLKLPLTLQNRSESISNDLLNDSNILAFFYGGSIAKGNTDLFSDLDLRIVVKDKHFESYRRNKKERAQRWGDVLFYEDFPWTSHSVAHYSDFVKVDSFYYKREDLKPSLYLKQAAKIVYDPHNIVKNVFNRSEQLDYHVNEEEFEIWRSKFFAHLHEVYRRVRRGEMFYALSSLDLLRWSIAAGWDMVEDRLPNQMGVWSNYEGNRSHFENWQLSLLESWHCGRNPEQMLIVLQSIIPEFKRLHTAMCDKLSLEEDSPWINEIINKVL